MPGRRPFPGFTVAGGPVYQRLAVQHFNETVGDLPAVIKTLVNDQGFFIQLGIEHPHQLVLPVNTRAGHVNITYFAISGFLHMAPHTLYPGQIAEAGFVVKCFHQHPFGSGQVGLIVVR
ncbi:hypothetical protein D9M68_937390 [compost metagenome]